MKKKFYFLVLASVLTLNSCSKDEAITDASFDPAASQADYYPASSLPEVTVSSDITSNTTWTNNRVYELDGVIFVKNGAELTIQAGTFIKGKSTGTTGDPQGVLVITQSGTINAVGTSNSPIVFTSYNLLDGNSETTASPEDFGGVILLGNATTNETYYNNIEGLPVSAETNYGGSNNSDNSGTIKYTRIEFAGDVLTPDNEINGLTLGGVGSGTTLENIQVSYSEDDSFQFFGGTVNATNLVSFAAKDDHFEFGNGYVGTVTNALALADVNSDHSGNLPIDPDSNGIEVQNNGAYPYTQIPQSNPTITDLCIFGASSSSYANNYLHGVRIRRGGAITLSNVVITGYNNGVVFDSGTEGADPLDSSISDVDLHGFTACKVPGSLNTGFGSRCETGSPGDEFGHIQPFFNDGTLNFGGTSPGQPSRGAFTNGTGWLSGWTKFDNF